MFWRIEKLYYDTKLKIRRFFTRGIKGYDKSDLWDIDSWFIEIMPRMLREFKAQNNGHPCELTMEDWNNILDRMIYCFEEADDVKCSQQNEWEDTFEIDSIMDYNDNSFHLIAHPQENWEKWTERDLEISKYREERLNEGLELFKKYFRELWW